MSTSGSRSHCICGCVTPEDCVLSLLIDEANNSSSSNSLSASSKLGNTLVPANVLLETSNNERVDDCGVVSCNPNPNPNPISWEDVTTVEKVHMEIIKAGDVEFSIDQQIRRNRPVKVPIQSNPSPNPTTAYTTTSSSSSRSSSSCSSSSSSSSSSGSSNNNSAVRNIIANTSNSTSNTSDINSNRNNINSDDSCNNRSNSNNNDNNNDNCKDNSNDNSNSSKSNYNDSMNNNDTINNNDKNANNCSSINNNINSGSSSSSPRSNSLKISGFEINYPVGKKPFPSQLAVINRTLGAISRKENALIESPTGTGKTLALLASVLAWIKKENESMKAELKLKSERDGSGLVYPNNIKGPLKDRPKKPKKRQVFYCSRTHSQLQQVLDELNSFEESNVGIKSCILSSRSHTCINEKIKSKSVIPGSSNNNKVGKVGQSLDDNCRLAVKESTCFYVNHGNISTAMDKGGSDLFIWDIEDIVKFGKKHKTCPYFLSKELLETADIVLVPYMYILDEGIQEASKINLEDAIIIFDEAHNIESVARECSSFKVSTTNLSMVCAELLKLSENGSVSFKVLYDLMQNLLNWVESFTSNNGSSSSGAGGAGGGYGNNSSSNTSRYSNNYNGNINNSNRGHNGSSSGEVVDGDALLKIFEKVLQLNKDSIEVFDHHFQVIARESDSVSDILKETRDDSSANNNGSGMSRGDDGGHPGGEEAATTIDDDLNNNADEELKSASKMVIRGFLAVMKTMIQAKYCCPSDFKIAILPDDQVLAGGGSAYPRGQSDAKKLNIWCMNAGASFNRINSLCRSIILASGTLAPLNSFQAELGIDFPLCLEAPHVIDVPSQVFSGAVASINRTPLLFTYQNQGNLELFESLGNLLINVVNITPGGVLMFFSSYGMLDKVLTYWKEKTGVYDDLISLLQNSGSTATGRTKSDSCLQSDCARRAATAPIFKACASSFNASNTGPLFIEPRDSKDVDRFLEDYYRLLDAPGGKAVMLAVCRGKVSEGVNFSNEYARTVLVVGIPYPSVGDIQVKLKREYQDSKRSNSANNRVSTGGNIANDVSFAMESDGVDSSSSNSSSIPKQQNHLSGSQWYSLQAFRAVNQCLGRCIRHKDDFGAVLLLDVRIADAVSDYHRRSSNVGGGGDGSSSLGIDEKNAVAMLSKWARSGLQRFDELDAHLLLQMKLFFQENVKSRRSKIIYDSFYGRINQIFQSVSNYGKVSVSDQDSMIRESMEIENLNQNIALPVDAEKASKSSDIHSNNGAPSKVILGGKSKGSNKQGGNVKQPSTISSLSQTIIGKAFKRVGTNTTTAKPSSSTTTRLSMTGDNPLTLLLLSKSEAKNEIVIVNSDVVKGEGDKFIARKRPKEGSQVVQVPVLVNKKEIHVSSIDDFDDDFE